MRATAGTTRASYHEALLERTTRTLFCDEAYVSRLHDSRSRQAGCEERLRAGSLEECSPGCAPSLAMLQLSETPVVTLSEGRFGTDEGLPKHAGSAPRPACGFGPFGETAKRRCNAPAASLAAAVVSDDQDVEIAACSNLNSAVSFAASRVGGVVPRAFRSLLVWYAPQQPPLL